MNFTELRKLALKEYYPGLFLENLWPKGLGKILLRAIRLLWGLFLVATLFFYGYSKTLNPEFVNYVPKFLGGFALSFALWMGAAAIHSFYNYYYFKSVPEGHKRLPKLSFELGRILYNSRQKDILLGFLKSDEGFEALLRAGISHEDMMHFLETRNTFIDGNMMRFKETEFISLSDYAAELMRLDTVFAQFLFAHGIQQNDFVAILNWVAERESARRVKARWWSKERLGRIPSIGKNWSYGKTYFLDKFERPMPRIDGDEYEVHDVYGTKELKLLEASLSRSKASNVFVVSNDKQGSEHIIARLNRLIEEGSVMPVLEHKRLVLINTDQMSASVKTKADFETELMSLLQEAVQAGNIILVIEDMPSLMNSAEKLGVDLPALLDSYINSQNLQIIALTSTDQFHKTIEPQPALMSRFDKILVDAIDEANTVRVLQNEVIALEKQLGVYFSYPALRAIAESAERYFPDGTMPQQAITLLYEIGPKVAHLKNTIVHKEDVLELIKTKTGIPVGSITSEEREKLLHLESILHQRIIGQDEAINAIANAARRARSGINNPNRPLASFLFLGPTGVGKTETTKALAQVFFGTEAEILRLDMSEYIGQDAIPKLIGSFAGDIPGVLASMVREHPYGVLLLDEFEKTTPEVMNLFLQILDEGFFSDMHSKHLNARNLLIIATSNAGSDMIWEAVKHGENLQHAKDMIMDSIIKSQTFKPELLNRFDGVVVFHPLGKEHLEKVARLQLEKLKTRLAERGINLVITDDLIQYLMQYGADPKFGARPMNRAIQDKIEQVIAEKMIRGDLQPGQEIGLTKADFE